MNNPFAVERFEFETGLSPEECRRRLSSELRAGRSQPWDGDSGSSAAGWCQRDRFQIWRIAWIRGIFPFNRMAFAPWARGRLVPTGQGTRVVVRLGLFPLFAATVLMMGVGFLFAFGFSVGCLLLAEVQVPSDPLAWLFEAAVLAFLLGFPAALLFVRWIDPRDIEFLKRFLANTLSPMTPPR